MVFVPLLRWKEYVLFVVVFFDLFGVFVLFDEVVREKVVVFVVILREVGVWVFP
jgi:hypothetical protein